jgi:hypothetical protein
MVLALIRIARSKFRDRCKPSLIWIKRAGMRSPRQCERYDQSEHGQEHIADGD